MSNIVIDNIYYQTQLDDDIILTPSQLDADYVNHLFDNLKIKVEGKCVKDGCIMKVLRVIKINSNYIDSETFSCNTIFNLTYECYLCSPIINKTIICKIKSSSTIGYLEAENGPIEISILLGEINSEVFETKNGGKNIFVRSTGKKVEDGVNGDYVVISLINIKINAGDKKINAIAKLLDMANEKQIEQHLLDIDTSRLKIGVQDSFI